MLFACLFVTLAFCLSVSAYTRIYGYFVCVCFDLASCCSLFAFYISVFFSLPLYRSVCMAVCLSICLSGVILFILIFLNFLPYLLQPYDIFTLSFYQFSPCCVSALVYFRFPFSGFLCFPLSIVLAINNVHPRVWVSCYVCMEA